MSNKLTTEQVAKLGKALDARLNEFLDGYAVIGFIAGSNEPLILIRPVDTKTRMALETLVVSSLGQFGGRAAEEE